MTGATPTVGMCESLLGTGPGVAKALKFDKPDSYSWLADWPAKHSSGDTRLSCVASGTSAGTVAIHVDVVKDTAQCTSVCGEPNQGVRTDISVEAAVPSERTLADPDAARTWLTEVARHVK